MNVANCLREIAPETLSNTLADVHLGTSSQIADRRAELEVEAIGNTVAELKAKKPLDTLSDRQAEMQVQTTH